MKPNYGAEKRRKELERKKKQEEKFLKRVEKKNQPKEDAAPEDGAVNPQTDTSNPTDGEDHP